jgi:hypothetical protein
MAALSSVPLSAEETGDLAAAAQNPIADLISLPFQNNMTFGWGPEDDIQNVLNIQPVWPFNLGEDWNLITRTILPVVSQPHLDDGGSTFGLGDTTFTGWFSPADSGGFVWGVGPVLLLPTATDDRLGTDQWGGGASVVALVMSGPWVAGGLVNNVWGFGGGDEDQSDLNQFLAQPFVNYNLDGGWYLVTAPIITGNWEASSDDRWTVPLGGGAGRVLRIGKQPVNINTQVYYNVEKPDWVGDWSWRLQIQLLFPK